MRCAACDHELEAFTGDVCPECQHFAHPTRLGQYRELELIRRGGMGSVYRARHPDLGTVVAIKTVQTHDAPQSLADRFEREARLAARIPHPGVVRVIDYDCQEGRLYLVMEYVEGETLRQPILAGRRELGFVLDVIAQLAEILQTAHERGIVHRDIKPENVMLDSTGRVRVLDFGISRVLGDGERLTQTGEILGTPEYISPEQILEVPEAVDARTDVYATGVVLYEMLTGTSPFAGANLFQVLKHVEAREPEPPSRLQTGLPAELDALVMACLEKDKERRPPDCRTLARRLRAMAGPSRVPVPPRGFARLGIVAVAAISLVAGFTAARVWPTGAGAVAEQSPGPAQRIRAIVAGKRPFDRYELVAAGRSIPDDAAPEDLYWRGMAHKQTGALFLALRDMEQAAARFDKARSEAAILWVYKYKLYPETLGEVWPTAALKLPIDGEEPLIQAARAVAANEWEVAWTHLAASAAKSDDLEILTAWCARRLARPGPRPPGPEVAASYVPSQLLHATAGALAAGELQAIARDVDRMAPLRYFLEVSVARLTNDTARANAALELAQVTGEASFAQEVFVALQLRQYDRSSRAERTALREFITALAGPNAAALQAALAEIENGKQPD